MGEHAEESIHLQPIDGMSESSDLLGRIAMRTQTVLGASHTEGNLLKILSTQHEKVLNRHRQLPGKLHTLEHHFDVHGRLSYLLSHLKDPVSITDRMKILMLEAAFRHDDGHVGKRYRQEMINGDSKSNEEYALLLLRKDFRGASKRIKDSDFGKLYRLILSTSSHQRPPIVTLDSPLYRPYEPKTVEEKLLVFADVCGCLLSGWEYWMAESNNYYTEEGMDKTRNKIWIQSRVDFLEYVIGLYNSSIKDFLDEETQDRIETNYKGLTDRLFELYHDLPTSKSKP